MKSTGLLPHIPSFQDAAGKQVKGHELDQDGQVSRSATVLSNKRMGVVKPKNKDIKELRRPYLVELKCDAIES